MTAQTQTLSLGTILHGDAATTLRTLPDNSFNCILTSPPYLGLRVYDGSEKTPVWGGEPTCVHDFSVETRQGLLHENRDFLTGTTPEEAHGATRTAYIKKYDETTSFSCIKCGAWRGALGLEPTLELYVDHLVGIFRFARRVLRDDGVFFLNISDSYCGSDTAGDGLKPKDLCLVPEKISIALQKDGWYVRDRVAWIKNRGKPDSATDRRTNTWEFIYTLTKSGKYWYDVEAVREPNSSKSSCVGGRKARNVIYADPEPCQYFLCKTCKKIYRRSEYGLLKRVPIGSRNYSGGVTAPNHGNVGERAHKKHYSRRCTCGKIDWLAHTATFPKALVEELILSGCPAWVCRKCGTPKTRLTKKVGEGDDKKTITTGWTDCDCGAGFGNGTVLDCFAGSGTTPAVAENLGRDWLGIEISEDYRSLALHRILTENNRPLVPVTELRRKGAQ